MEDKKPSLIVKRIGIDTYKEAVIYIPSDCYICQSEGFEAQARIRISLDNHRFIIATLNTIKSNTLNINHGEAGLSEYAWKLLGAHEGDSIYISHPEPLSSLGYVRGKIHGIPFSSKALTEIVKDVVAGRFSDIHVAFFLTSTAGDRLNQEEIKSLTVAMVNAGDRMIWPSKLIVDKHCVGGLPGNRTSLIVVPIAAAFGLTIPKTSSRAITSSAGTADTMETLAPVDLTFTRMKEIVEQENGCLAWGGSVALSPADDILITVERALDLDSDGQMVASVLSKKIAAGSNHVIIDIPIGPTAKVRSFEKGYVLKDYLENSGDELGIKVKVIFTDGTQPIGNGIGPALEARDVLAVLKREPNAPQDLRERALMLAGHVLEFSPQVKPGEGFIIAEKILDSGQAWDKFKAICEAQGGLRVPPIASHTHVITAKKCGKVISIDNRRIARVAKLAGAPHDRAAGVELHVKVDSKIKIGQPLFTIHAETPGELVYALNFVEQNYQIIQIG